MFSHIMVGSNDIDRSKHFYDPTFVGCYRAGYRASRYLSRPLLQLGVVYCFDQHHVDFAGAGTEVGRQQLFALASSGGIKQPTAVQIIDRTLAWRMNLWPAQKRSQSAKRRSARLRPPSRAALR
jgi:hypothetical protein